MLGWIYQSFRHDVNTRVTMKMTISITMILAVWSTLEVYENPRSLLTYLQWQGSSTVLVALLRAFEALLLVLAPKMSTNKRFNTNLNLSMTIVTTLNLNIASTSSLNVLRYLTFPSVHRNDCPVLRIDGMCFFLAIFVDWNSK